MSEAATVLGLSSDDTAGALRAIEQMISKGTVQAEELRGQLGERLPGAFQLAARAMGVTTEELSRMLQRGDVLASDLLPKLATELHKTFGPEAEKAAGGLRQALNRLSTETFELSRQIGDFLKGPATGFVNWLAEVVRNLRAPSAPERLEELRTAIAQIQSQIEKGIPWPQRALSWFTPFVAGSREDLQRTLQQLQSQRDEIERQAHETWLGQTQKPIALAGPSPQRLRRLAELRAELQREIDIANEQLSIEERITQAEAKRSEILKELTAEEARFKKGERRDEEAEQRLEKIQREFAQAQKRFDDLSRQAAKETFQSMASQLDAADAELAGLSGSLKLQTPLLGAYEKSLLGTLEAMLGSREAAEKYHRELSILQSKTEGATDDTERLAYELDLTVEEFAKLKRDAEKLALAQLPQFEGAR